MRLGTRLLTRVSLLAAVTLALSGCFYPLALKHQQDSPDTRPWWCTHLPHETPHDEHGTEWYRDQGITKGDLSWDDCLAVSQHLQSSLEFAQQWPTRGDAEADGWVATVNYATGMGTHHREPGPQLPPPGVFDPDRPTYLQYDGNSPDAKLVGMSWYVNSGPDAPPEGFPGDNDWWHSHPELCISNTTGLVIRDGPCLPGQNGFTVDLSDYWMLHAWIVPGWQIIPDVFMNHHPCLLPGGPAGPEHDCWHEAAGH